MGEPAHRVWNSSSQAWLDMRTTWAAFQTRWCQVGNRNQCPCGHSLKLLVPCEGMISHSHSVTLSVSLSYTHIKYTYTHTRAHQPGSSTQRVSSREHGFSWQQLCPPAASGQEPNCTEEPGGSRGRLFLPPHPPHSHPIAIPKGDQDPNKTEGFHKDQYPTSLQLLDSDFSKPHSYKINPKLLMLLVGAMVQIP